MTYQKQVPGRRKMTLWITNEELDLLDQIADIHRLEWGESPNRSAAIRKLIEVESNRLKITPRTIGETE